MKTATIPVVLAEKLTDKAYFALKEFAYGADGHMESGYSYLVSADAMRSWEQDYKTDTSKGLTPAPEYAEAIALFREVIDSNYKGLVLVLHPTETEMVQ